MDDGLNAGEGPVLFAILNVTPDSFSDGARFSDVGAAVDAGLALLDEGADWLDVGGESTRPGSEPIPAEEELSRVLPVIRGLLSARPGAAISIDTMKATVAEAALDAGARLVNDVSALSDPAMAPLCARFRCEVVLMHRRGDSRTMQVDTTYGDLVDEVCELLRVRRDAAVAAGISAERIWLDPGVGFGKAVEDNPRLIAATPRLRQLGHRVLIGASRKAFIGRLTGVKAARDRVHGSVGAALAAAALGADGLRVHDVAATHQALAVYRAIVGP